jgi:hypothetical protein
MQIMEYNFGNWSQKRTVVLDGKTVKVQKKNGELIQSWNLDELEGVAYVAPNGLTQGVMVFCENYHASLEKSLMKLGMIPHSFIVTLSDRDSAQAIIEWFNKEKGSK